MKKAFNEVHKAVLACEDTDGRKRCELFRELPDRRVRVSLRSNRLGYSRDITRTILTITNSSRTLLPFLPSVNVSLVDITRVLPNTGTTGNSCLTMPGRTTKKGHGSTSMPRKWRKSSTLRSPEPRLEPTFRAPHRSRANLPHPRLGRTTLR